MNVLKIYSCCGGLLALLGLLTGCTPSKSFRNSFVPPAHAPAEPRLVVAPPPVLPPQRHNDNDPVAPPAIASIQSIPRPSETATIRQAEIHYQAGRKLYLAGDENGARREFDAAVDLLLSAPGTPDGRGVIDRKLDEMVQAVHRLDLAGLGAGDTGEPAFEKAPIEDIPQLTFPIDPKLKNKVLEEVRATASQLPLDVNDAVLSYINYFSSERGRKVLLAGLRRAGRYRPLIQRILDEEGVPQELIFLAQAESGFMPRAVSSKKATGMWQFVLLRGREYGLKQSAFFDERLDPEKATRAAARHLRDLYQHFGDWYLAMAGYNSGPVTVDRAVERTGYADFWELRDRNVLPKETANYVPIILAMTIMVKNAREYGIEGIDADPPLEYETVEIDAPTSLLLVADLAECPVSQIRDLNPALLKSTAPEGWMLRVPKGSGVLLSAALEMIPAERRDAWRAHRLAEGETLAAIAGRYRVTEASLAAANRSMDGDLEPGDLVVIPAAAQPATKKVVKKPVRRASASSKTAKKAAPRSRVAAYRASNEPAKTAKNRTARR
jgi:membrane-bound lytic murein transglycosylase D